MSEPPSTRPRQALILPEPPGHASMAVALASEADTVALMADLALLVTAGAVIALEGDLGAGKTTAARGFIRFFAGDETLDVPSPTFTLMQSYELPGMTVHHADLYRIAHADELEELGLSPWPADAVTLIEWPDRAGSSLPADRISVALSIDPVRGNDLRRALVTGHGTAAATVARFAALRRFLADAGIDAGLRRSRVAGDASSRSYARLHEAAAIRILMNAPPRPDGPPVHDGKSYSAAVHLAETVKPFVAMAKALRAQQLSAPRIDEADLDRGFLLIEDLGADGVVAGDPPQPIVARYEAAIDMLATLHRQTLPKAVPIAPRMEHVIPHYDRDALLIEAGLLLDWYLPDHGVAVDDAQRARFRALWSEALAPVLKPPWTWVLRDLHSPNLIWLGGRDGNARVGLIDFQDAVIGPPAYDVASLAQDARIDMAEPLERALLARYIARRTEATADFDAAAFERAYAVLAAQRASKILGIFARLNRRDGKPHYRAHQPRVYGYLQRSLAHPALAALKAWYDHAVPPPAEAPPAAPSC